MTEDDHHNVLHCNAKRLPGAGQDPECPEATVQK